VDVEFGEFMSDDLAMAVKILGSAGLEFGERSQKELTKYLSGNPRNKEGRVVYDLRGDFGVQPGELYERFSFYFEAFPQIDREVH
jgi:hypothetical protein